MPAGEPFGERELVAALHCLKSYGGDTDQPLYHLVLPSPAGRTLEGEADTVWVGVEVPCEALEQLDLPVWYAEDRASAVELNEQLEGPRTSEGQLFHCADIFTMRRAQHNKWLLEPHEERGRFEGARVRWQDAKTGEHFYWPHKCASVRPYQALWYASVGRSFVRSLESFS